MFQSSTSPLFGLFFPTGPTGPTPDLEELPQGQRLGGHALVEVPPGAVALAQPLAKLHDVWEGEERWRGEGIRHR